jgi:hypothetical protein
VVFTLLPKQGVASVKSWTTKTVLKTRFRRRDKQRFV